MDEQFHPPVSSNHHPRHYHLLRVELRSILKSCSSIDSDPYSEDDTDHGDSTVDSSDTKTDCISEKESPDTPSISWANNRLDTKPRTWCSSS